MASTNSYSNLKLIFLIMFLIEAAFLCQHCVWESQQWLSLFSTFAIWKFNLNIYIFTIPASVLKLKNQQNKWIKEQIKQLGVGSELWFPRLLHPLSSRPRSPERPNGVNRRKKDVFLQFHSVSINWKYITQRFMLILKCRRLGCGAINSKKLSSVPFF